MLNEIRQIFFEKVSLTVLKADLRFSTDDGVQYGAQKNTKMLFKCHKGIKTYDYESGGSKFESWRVY